MSTLTIDKKEWAAFSPQLRSALLSELPEKTKLFTLGYPPENGFSDDELMSSLRSFVSGEIDEDCAECWLSGWRESGFPLPRGVSILLSALIEKDEKKLFDFIIERIDPVMVPALDRVGVSGTQKDMSPCWTLMFEQASGEDEGKIFPVDAEISDPTLLGVCAVHDRLWAAKTLLEKGCSPSDRRKSRKQATVPTSVVIARSPEMMSLLVSSPKMDFSVFYGDDKKRQYVLNKPWGSDVLSGKEIEYVMKMDAPMKNEFLSELGKKDISVVSKTLAGLSADKRSQIEMEILALRQPKAGKPFARQGKSV